MSVVFPAPLEPMLLKNIEGLQIKINPVQNQRFAIPFGQPTMYIKQKKCPGVVIQ